MIHLIARPWFEARSLAALQVYLNQPLKKPLPDFEARLLRGAVKMTMRDRGTPIDAAFRFYAGYAETAARLGRNLEDIGFSGALGRLWALQNEMKFFNEHITSLKSVSAIAAIPSQDKGDLGKTL